ncbi:MAG: winged helix-turn-helix domain-containing protein, partial [Pseudonocardia sp.]|nr:winged helix-turn-helix domain-containing protein [Pseudonocardia sp.]
MVAVEHTFGVLGALEVHRHGNPVPLSSPRQRAVLAALLAQSGRPVSGDALIEAAWGADLPASPRGALHTLLSRLRSALGPDAIGSEPAGYRLGIGPDALDADRFEALRERAARAPTREALDLLDAADALWRGPAFAEFADREFATAEAVRLDELRLAVVEDRAALRLEFGDPGATAADLEGFVHEHPLRERSVGLLMTALYRAGRAGEALDRYLAHQRLLAEELGLDPAPALRELQARILDHELPGAAPAPPRWLPSDAPFLGRDDEITELHSAAATHRLVTVTGVGGVGKTRLAAEALPGLVERLGLPAAVVELAGFEDGRVEVAVASALALGPVRGELGEAVLEYLSVTPMLLVVDNCEHVAQRAGALIGAVLRRCPRVRVLATSRRRLGLPAEQVLPLEPLAVPAAGAAAEVAALSAAVRLFADRSRRVRPASAPRQAQLSVVGEICRRLDGLPLAIELAATRAATLGVEALSARLDQGIDLLDG